MAHGMTLAPGTKGMGGQGMDTTQVIGLGVAFVAGLVSFLSPCVLPLIPTYLTYLAGVGAGAEAPAGGGVAGADARDGRHSRRRLLNAVAFVIGFTLVFVVLGLGAAGLGALTAAIRYRGLLRQLGGLVVIVFGLQMTGLIHIGFMERQVRPDIGGPSRSARSGLASALTSALIGMAFGFGWTPCVGPVLASILVMAAGTASLARAVLLLVAYSAGLALPFLAAAIFLDPLLGWLRRRGNVLAWVGRVAGVLMVLMGLALYFNYLARLEVWLGR